MPDREITANFTGHRPAKFAFRYDETAPGCLSLKACISEAVAIAHSRGYRRFISGMALGVDTWSAEAVLAARESGLPGISLVAALPCRGQESRWPEPSRQRHASILAAADEVTLVTDAPYTPRSMFVRDCWMVDRSSLLIAVYDGTPGGTRHTWDYARRQGLDAIRILPPDGVDGSARIQYPEPEPELPEPDPSLF